jgi:hypothetical protein
MSVWRVQSCDCAVVSPGDEADVIGQVDYWIAELFGPEGIDATLSRVAEQAARSRTPRRTSGRRPPVSHRGV